MMNELASGGVLMPTDRDYPEDNDEEMQTKLAEHESWLMTEAADHLFEGRGE